MATPLVSRFRLESVDGGFRIAPISGSDTTLLNRLCSPSERLRIWPGILQLVVGQLMVAARRAGLELLPKGLLDDPLLVLTEQSVPAPQEGVLQPFSAHAGAYAAHGGITDLYPEYASSLQAALSSSDVMDTGWFGAKKEIQFARIRRASSGAELTIEVRVEADDGLAQADTAVWKAFGGNAACESGRDALAKLGLTRAEALAQMEALAAEAGLGETVEARRSATLPADSTFEALMEKLSALTDEADQELETRTEVLNHLAALRMAKLKGGA